ncbi:hypothetical protein V2J09_012504 [Rumex salicifolius]
MEGTQVSDSLQRSLIFLKPFTQCSPMASLILGTSSMAAQTLSVPSMLSSSKCISGVSLSIPLRNLALSTSSPSPSLPPIYCGRGDRKTAKGKRFAHSFGNARPHNKKKGRGYPKPPVPPPEPKNDPYENIEKVNTEINDE